MKKIFIYLFIILFVFSIIITSDTLIKVGIVDLEYINSIYKEVTIGDIKIDHLKTEKKEYYVKTRDELSELKEEINELNKDDAKRDKLIEKYNSLAKEAKKQIDNYDDQIKDLNNNREEHRQNDIKYAIRKVSEINGYSIILNKNSNLLYYTDSVELTKLVEEYLWKMINRYCSDNNIDIEDYFPSTSENNE